MRGPQAGNAGEANRLCRHDAHHPVDHVVILVDQHGIAEAKARNGLSGFLHMDGIDFTQFARGQRQLSHIAFDKGELRQKVVARSGRRRGGLHSGEAIAASAALLPQRIPEGRLEGGRLRAVFHLRFLGSEFGESRRRELGPSEKDRWTPTSSETISIPPRNPRFLEDDFPFLRR